MKKYLIAVLTLVLVLANISAVPMPEIKAAFETPLVGYRETEIFRTAPNRAEIEEEEELDSKTETSSNSSEKPDSSTCYECLQVEKNEVEITSASEQDVCLIAKTIWGEARGLSYYEKCQVAWCILNRVDCSTFPNTVFGVVTQSGQYYGYSASHPAEGDCYAAALDVYGRWLAEKAGEIVQRELGSAYIYFGGDGIHNYYRTVY